MDSRKPRMTRLPGLLAAAMLLLTLASLPASGESQYQLVVFREGGQYQVGDTVRLELHFFDRENYINATEINLTAGYDGPYIEVDETAARQATGVYEVSFVLAEEHAPYGFLRLDITAYAVAGSDNPDDRAEESMMFWLRGSEVTNFDIEVEADPLEPRPGDSVTFTASFTNFSTPVDPPEADIAVNLTAFDEWVEGATLARQSTGVYTLTYSVPQDQTKGGDIALRVEAEYNGDSGRGYGNAQLHFYDAWIHTLEFTESAFTGELYLSDMEGRVAAGVEVNFSVAYDGPEFEQIKVWNNGTTDASGKLALALALPGWDAHDLSVSLTANGTYQDRNEGWLGYQGDDDDDFVPDKPYGGFEIIAQQDSRGGLEGDADVEFTFRAYNGSEPLTGVELYVYVTNGAYDFTAPQPLLPAVIVHEKVITDATGNFTLAFRTPAECGSLRVIAKAYLPGVEWDDTNYTSDSDYLSSNCVEEPIEDPSLSLKVTNFGLGQRATLTASKSGLGEDDVALFMIFPVGDRVSVDTDAETEMEVEWQRISSFYFGGPPSVFQELKGGSATVEFLLPEFLPAENYVVMVIIFTDDESYLNFLVLDAEGNVVGGLDTGGEDDDDDDGFLPGPGLLLAGVALMAVAVRRRR